MGLLPYDYTTLNVGDVVTITLSGNSTEFPVVSQTIVNGTVIAASEMVIVLSYSMVVYDICCDSSEEARRRYVEKDMSGFDHIADFSQLDFIVLARDEKLISVLVNLDLKTFNSFYAHEIETIELIPKDD